MIFDDTKSQFQIKEFDENILSESIFDRSLSLQLEFEEADRKATLEFYDALQEKADYREAVSRFKATIRTSMRAYLDKSRLEVEYFARAFEKRIENDKEVITPHLAKLKRYLKEYPLVHILFKTEDVRYNYTYIMEDKVPNVKYMDTYLDKNIDLDAINAYKGYSDYQKLELIEKEYNDLVDYIKSGQCYARARGYILCKTGIEIAPENFDTELFKIYRDGGEELPSSVTVNDVLKAIDRFDKYTKAIKNIEDDFDAYSSRRMKVVMDQLNKLDMVNAKHYFGNDKDSFDTWYSMYIALKNEQLMRLTAIHHHCINAKLDALVKSYIQDRNTLVKAIGIDKAEEEFVAESFDIYDYTGFLIEERYNALDLYIEAMKITGTNLTEAQIESLQEGVMDNLKNFLSNMAGKISDVINKFAERANELFGDGKKFIEDNQKKLLSGQVFDNATIDNYYPCPDLTQRLGSLNFKLANVSEIEQNALEDRWQTDVDYIKSAVSIAGFTYKENEGSLKEQLITLLRGQKQQLNSKEINKQFLTEAVKYCTTDFPAIKKTLDNDKEVLKTFAKSMDTYIASKKANSNATTTTTTTQAQTIVSGNGQAQSTNDSFNYQDTLDMYFHEVDIKDNNPGDSGVKQSLDGAKKKGDDLKKIATAFKSYIKVNAQLVSTKMKLAVEHRKQYMKIMKWYVKEYNSQNSEGKETKNNEGKTTNNKSISDSIK